MTRSSFSENYKTRSGDRHIYPTEWIIRTLLGKYPSMVLDKEGYANSRVLDMGFGDGRNFPLLNNLDFELYGVETDEAIIATVRERLKDLVDELDLRVGSNSDIPFGSEYFDYLVASFSMYYLSKGKTFRDNVLEYSRVIKKDGILITTLAEKKTFVFRDAIDRGNGEYEITNDPFNLRNGDRLQCFASESEIRSALSEHFQNIRIGRSYNDYYGMHISYFMVVADRK